ncbi:hypothetical protein PVAP13_2KG229058 [Panicum virgatum]|uniref:Sulfite exporter TauE/SafE family protein n=1 Tax=Panicum virgatum TaxID=38727 RepID=A0A8T0WEA7_PANVG|nr:hypothetical protein PVAP13_2KG229058 [Panicum virgatum]
MELAPDGTTFPAGQPRRRGSCVRPLLPGRGRLQRRRRRRRLAVRPDPHRRRRARPQDGGCLLHVHGHGGHALQRALHPLPPPRRPSIDYGIAVVSQPCLLLGVSAGVVCNVVFPEWLVTALFSLFLAFATFKTYRAGVRRWRAETAELGGAAAAEVEPLLGRNGGGRRCQWVDLLVLVTVWLCFFAMHLFIGGDGAKGAFNIKPCGIAYWLITVAQIPVAEAFTACIGRQRRKSQAQHGVDQATSVCSKLDALPAYVFPVAALLTGVMSGLFGIGGGLLLNPVLLQIGVPPKTASATTMFMVLFCASMSMAQFIILGVPGIASALVYGATCFAASAVGLAAIEGAVRRSGRASLIVFVVAGILALSAAVIACSGAVRVWGEYTSGQYMGFKMPC